MQYSATTESQTELISGAIHRFHVVSSSISMTMRVVLWTSTSLNYLEDKAVAKGWPLAMSLFNREETRAATSERDAALRGSSFSLPLWARTPTSQISARFTTPKGTHTQSPLTTEVYIFSRHG